MPYFVVHLCTHTLNCQRDLSHVLCGCVVQLRPVQLHMPQCTHMGVACLTVDRQMSFQQCCPILLPNMTEAWCQCYASVINHARLRGADQRATYLKTDSGVHASPCFPEKTKLVAFEHQLHAQSTIFCVRDVHTMALWLPPMHQFW